jgi:hypothetical protein
VTFVELVGLDEVLAAEEERVRPAVESLSRRGGPDTASLRTTAIDARPPALAGDALINAAAWRREDAFAPPSAAATSN